MIVHCSYDVKALLIRPGDRHLHGLLADEEGRSLTPTEARERLAGLLAEGQLRLGFGGCPNFDPQRGCCCDEMIRIEK